MQQPKSAKTKRQSQQKSQIRIIGGSMRGRKINFSAGEGLRPTLDQVRETLFNWLAADIHGATCLDLYAGSGALGIEAISRGAGSVALVDASKRVADNLKKNLGALSIDNARVINQKAEQFLSSNQQSFDLVFLDPPFDKDMLNSILTQIKPHLAEGALVYVEQENAGSTIIFAEEWQVLKSKKTSRFCYSLLALTG
jgi:16S rRNA (guanine966-N2)-methyltransferase